MGSWDSWVGQCLPTGIAVEECRSWQTETGYPRAENLTTRNLPQTGLLFPA